MLKRILFRLFWNSYDHLGGWMLVSAAAFALMLPLFTAPAAWGGLLHCAARADNERELGLAEFWKGLRRFGWRSTLMGLIAALVMGLGAANVQFYLAHEATAGLPPLARVALAGLFGWLALYAWLAIQVGWAFMALQDLPIGRALRRGGLVVVAHPFSALATLALGAGLALLMAMSGVGLVLLLGCLLANLAMGLTAGAIEHYEELEDRRERQRLEREGHKTWAELRALEEREAARHRRYDRSLRELIKPWEMK